MITRRNFLQALGVLGVCCTATYSTAMAVYNKATIFMSDFGGLIVKPIKGVTDKTGEAQEIVKNGGLLHPRGTGHSVMGQSLKEGATIFTPEDIDITFRDGIVYASGGTTLLDIDNYLEQHGYMLPTSPDHRSVSLGGVLSVGGYGGEVCRYGALVDHVKYIDLLTKDGLVLKNIPANDPMAQRVICGVGKHGTILKAGVRCVKKPLFSHVAYEDIPSVEFYVEQIQNFLNAPDNEKEDIWYAHWAIDQHELTRGKTFFDSDAPEPPKGYYKRKDYRADRKRVSDAWVFKRPYEYHIWSDHFFTIDNFKPAFERADEIVRKGREEGGSIIIYSSVGKGNNKSKHFPHYTDQDYLISIGIFANYLKEDKAIAKDMARTQMLYSKEAQEKWNGRPYRYGWEWQEDFKEL